MEFLNDSALKEKAHAQLDACAEDCKRLHHYLKKNVANRSSRILYCNVRFCKLYLTRLINNLIIFYFMYTNAKSTCPIRRKTFIKDDINLNIKRPIFRRSFWTLNHPIRRITIPAIHKQGQSTSFGKEPQQALHWLNSIHLNPRGFVATHWVEEYAFFPQGFFLHIRLTLQWNSLHQTDINNKI